MTVSVDCECLFLIITQPLKLVHAWCVEKAASCAIFRSNCSIHFPSILSRTRPLRSAANETTKGEELLQNNKPNVYSLQHIGNVWENSERHSIFSQTPYVLWPIESLLLFIPLIALFGALQNFETCTYLQVLYVYRYLYSVFYSTLNFVFACSIACSPTSQPNSVFLAGCWLGPYGTEKE